MKLIEPMLFKLDNMDAEEERDSKHITIEAWDGNWQIADIVAVDTGKVLCSISVKDAYDAFRILNERREEDLREQRITN